MSACLTPPRASQASRKRWPTVAHVTLTSSFAKSASRRSTISRVARRPPAPSRSRCETNLRCFPESNEPHINSKSSEIVKTAPSKGRAHAPRPLFPLPSFPFIPCTLGTPSEHHVHEWRNVVRLLLVLADF